MKTQKKSSKLHSLTTSSKKLTENMFARLFILCLAAFLIFANSYPGFAKDLAGHSDDESIQEKIDELLAKYEKELEYELAYGERIEVDDPVDGKYTRLTGESEKKMEGLWQETVRKINLLKARSPEEQKVAVELIQSLEKGLVTYLDQDRTAYMPAATLERYQAGKYTYSLDIETNQIIEINLIDDRSYSTEKKYAERELEKMAISFIEKVAPTIKLGNLIPTHGNKEGQTFFFRWEDPSRKLSGGIPAFVQVGFSSAGDLVHFVNTVPLLAYESSTKSFNQIYANGGGYWGWSGSSYATHNNAGYCYIAGWCSPKNVYWSYTQTGWANRTGYWYPNPNSLVRASAFIPSHNATNIQACYASRHSNGTHNRCINQNVYYNTWVLIVHQNLNNINRIALGNGVDVGTMQNAWDEVWVYTP
jgi:hypothetical protein